MRFLIALLPFLILSAPALADTYQLFREKDKIGIKDDAGKVLIPAAFDALGWSDGSFSVVSGVTGYKIRDHWGLINLKKEFLSKPEYENLTWSGGDRFIVQKKISAVRSATGCLDLKGQVVVPFRYDGIKINGLRAIVFVQENARYHYGLIDLNGQELIPVRYASIRPLGTLRYAVENDARKTALFSDVGKPVTAFDIDSLSDFHNGLAIIYRDFFQGALNREGEIIATPTFSELKINDDGTLQGRMPDEWKVLSGDNTLIRKIDADQLLPLTATLYHIVRKGKHGIVDDDFRDVLPLQYDYLGTLSDHKIVAGKGGKFGIIRPNNSVVLPIEYDSVVLEGRLVRVRQDFQGRSAWSLYDTFAIRKTEKRFDFIAPFNGMFFPARKNRYWGGIDRYGKESIQCVYDSLLGIDGDHVAVRFMGQYGIITGDEHWLLPPQPLRPHPVHPDAYWIKSGPTTFLRSWNGTDIYFTDNPIRFEQGYMIETSADGGEKHIDYQGRIVERSAPVLVQQTEKIFPESEGLRGFRKDGKFGFVDDRGRLRIANRYDGIGSFHEGIASVKIVGKWGYISKAEKIVVGPAYDFAGDFSKGRAIVRRSGKYGVIDPDGKQIVMIRYDSVVPVAGDMYRLRLGNYYGIADARGQILVDTRYDRVDNLNNGYCIIRRDGKSGLLTLQGLSTIPLQYDQLIYDRERNEYLGLLKSAWKKI